MKNNIFNKVFIVLLFICIGTIKPLDSNELLKNTIINELREGFAKIKKQSEKDDAFDENIALIECILNSSLIPQPKQTDWGKKSVACNVSNEEIKTLYKNEIIKNAELAPLSLEEQIEILKEANKDYSFIVAENIIVSSPPKQNMDKFAMDYMKLYFLKMHLKGFLSQLKIDRYIYNKKITFKTVEDIVEYRKKQRDFFEKQLNFFITANSVLMYAIFPESEEDTGIKTLCTLKDSDEIKKLQQLSLDQIVDKVGGFLDNVLKNDKSPKKDIKKEFMEFLYGGLLQKYDLKDIINAFKLQENKHIAFGYMAKKLEETIEKDPESKELKMYEIFQKNAINDQLAMGLPLLIANMWSYYLITIEIDKHAKNSMLYNVEKIKSYLDKNLILEGFFNALKHKIAIVKKINCYFKEHQELFDRTVKELKDSFSEIEKKAKNNKDFNKDSAVIECILNSSLTPKQSPADDMFKKSLLCNMNHQKYLQMKDKETITLAQEEPFTLTEKIKLLEQANKSFGFIVIKNMINNLLEGNFFDNDYFKGLSHKAQEVKRADHEINFIPNELARILLVLKINQYGENKQISIEEHDTFNTLLKKCEIDAFGYQLIGFLNNYFFIDNRAMLLNNDLIQSLVALKDSAEVKALKNISLDQIIIKLGDYFNKNLNNDKSIELAFMQTVYGKEIFRYELHDIIDSLRKNKDSCDAFVDMADYIEKEMQSGDQKIVDRFNETKKNLLAHEKESWSPFPFILLPAWRNYLIDRAVKAHNIGNESELKEYLENTVLFDFHMTKNTQMIVAKINCYVEEHKQDDAQEVSSKGLMHIKSAEEYRKIRLRHKNDVYLVKVGATWCPPCRMFEKVMEEYSKNNPKINLYSIDQDEVPGIVSEISQDQEKEIVIHSIPAIFLMKGGKIIKKAAGSMNLENLNKFIDEELNKKDV